MDVSIGQLFEYDYNQLNVPAVVQVVGFTKSKKSVYIRQVPLINVHHDSAGGSGEIDWKWIDENELKEPVTDNK